MMTVGGMSNHIERTFTVESLAHNQVNDPTATMNSQTYREFQECKTLLAQVNISERCKFLARRGKGSQSINVA